MIAMRLRRFKPAIRQIVFGIKTVHYVKAVSIDSAGETLGR